MNAASLLEFARGPALWFSLAVLFAGSAWRVAAILRLASRSDLSEPRDSRPIAGGMRAIMRKMIPRREFRRSGKLGMLQGYLYHLGLAVVVFGYAPHIAFVERLTGISWPALPDALMYLAAPLAMVSLAVVLLERLTDPVLRPISTFDDYFSWAVVFLPLVTGMAAIGEWSPQSAAGVPPPYAIPLAIHLLSVELLFVWLPFGKLAHAFLVFASRGVTGAALSRKGAAI